MTESKETLTRHKHFIFKRNVYRSERMIFNSIFQIFWTSRVYCNSKWLLDMFRNNWLLVLNLITTYRYQFVWTTVLFAIFVTWVISYLLVLLFLTVTMCLIIVSCCCRRFRCALRGNLLAGAYLQCLGRHGQDPVSGRRSGRSCKGSINRNRWGYPPLAQVGEFC